MSELLDDTLCHPHDFACTWHDCSCPCEPVQPNECWECDDDARLREIARRLVDQIGDPEADVTGCYTDLLLAARELLEARRHGMTRLAYIASEAG